jgi:two-component system NarL family response regulator
MLAEDQSWFPPFLLQEVFTLARGKTEKENNVKHVLHDLTPREREIALSVSGGLSNKEVARQLAITERTVKAHLSNVFEKLNVKDRMALSILLRE